jgi:hypothetical protein
MSPFVFSKGWYRPKQSCIFSQNFPRNLSPLISFQKIHQQEAWKGLHIYEKLF